ncbi:serine palmitoyltransferase 2-like isoform X2 [Folsomia candida]|uniref:serine palmitoyltransferase 2-like isoform X2 n=1 Tax=Folsomia candida TaxID=158441 RepID=UPI001604EE8C|nr:serine palmitoyltransferase 2-like isoform X2 [Folsomia candida]
MQLIFNCCTSSLEYKSMSQLVKTLFPRNSETNGPGWILERFLTREEDREGYPSLRADIFLTYGIRRVRDLSHTPVKTLPGEFLTIEDRKLREDGGWALDYTGKQITCVDMGSFNYLGFASNDGKIMDDVMNSMNTFGLTACSACNEFGEFPVHIELEKLVAKFLRVEDAIVCGSGFATNVLNIPAIMDENTLVFSDAKNHSSVIMGFRLSKVSVRVFRHNDLCHLEKLLFKLFQSGEVHKFEKIIVIVEGVYSMDGSILQLPELIRLKEIYKFYIYLEEAHSFGAMGPNGGGIVDYFNCDPNSVDIYMGTFSKSLWAAGGYIAGSRQLVQHLRENGYSHAHATAMPPPIAQQIISSIQSLMADGGTAQVARLKSNSTYFKEKLIKRGFFIYGDLDSPIAPVACPHPAKQAFILRELRNRGVIAAGVGHPAVGTLEARMRFCMSAAHSKESLDYVVEQLTQVADLVFLRDFRIAKKYEEIIFAKKLL